MGCNYNKPWEVFSPEMVAESMQQARAAIHTARQHLDNVIPVEAALIEAVEKRFQQEGAHEEEVLKGWNDDYAAAMRLVYQAYPEDWDVAGAVRRSAHHAYPLAVVESGKPASLPTTLLQRKP